MSWTRFVVLAAVVALVNVPSGSAQSPRNRPAFEVASIKPCKDDGVSPDGRQPRSGGVRSSLDSLHLGCTTLETLIRFAYIRYATGKPSPRNVNGLPLSPVSFRLQTQPIKGMPAWVGSDLYTIDAKPDRPQIVEMMRGPMMQTLLEDRFKLRIHSETRPVPVYFLTVAKGGARLQPARKSCTNIDIDAVNVPRSEAPPPPEGLVCGIFSPGKNGEGVDTYSQTMEYLCRQLSGALDRDVIDKTGIADRHDIHLDLPLNLLFGNSDPTQPSDPFGDISAALHKLGLKLESAKGSGRFLVVDRVEKPTEN
jgi:uncharacterized protein (TIGR03435 family)